MPRGLIRPTPWQFRARAIFSYVFIGLQRGSYAVSEGSELWVLQV